MYRFLSEPDGFRRLGGGGFRGGEHTARRRPLCRSLRAGQSKHAQNMSNGL